MRDLQMQCFKMKKACIFSSFSTAEIAVLKPSNEFWYCLLEDGLEKIRQPCCLLIKE